MLPFMWGAQEKCIQSTTALLADAATIFTITGGPIQILELLSVCVVANSAVATTLQWSSTPAVGSDKTISGASASLSAIAAGTTILLAPTALTTAPTVVTAANGGVQAGPALSANHIIVLNGTLKLVIANAGTGTFYHCLRYAPLTPSSLVN